MTETQNFRQMRNLAKSAGSLTNKKRKSCQKDLKIYLEPF